MRSPIGRSYDNRIRGFSDQETSASHAPDTGPSAPPGKPLAVARVCVIRQGYYPLDVRVRREVRALTMAGHEVEVICLKERDDPGRKQAEGVRVHRIPIAARRGGQLRYLLEYAVFFLAAMMLVTALHFRRRFDLVQVHSMPDFLVFAAIVPRLLGARVLLDLHESMPEFYAVKFATGMRHPSVRLLAWMEQAAINFADAAITCTDLMREAFEGRGASRDKITVIMNSANDEEFDPQRYPPVKAAGEFRIISHGSLERRYGLDTIVRAVALLKDEIPDLRLDIYGFGSALDEVRSLVGELGIKDRVCLPGRFMPLDDVLRAIANADIGVVAIQRDIFRDLTHCNKMFEFIAMRKPAIVSRTRSVEAYFDDSCFEMFTAGNEHDLARAIRRLHADPGRCERLVEQAARVYEPYRWPGQRERYQHVVEKLIANRKVDVPRLPQLQEPETPWRRI